MTFHAAMSLQLNQAMHLQHHQHQPSCQPPDRNLHSPSPKADLLDLLCTSPEGTPSKEDWALDLELMHHFSTVTCNTIAVRPDARYTWQYVLPTEGYSNEYVMHGLLAMAAMHCSYLYPAQRDRYSKASAYHQAAGLKEFRDLIASPIDASNWQPVFCFASMITVHVYCSGAVYGVAEKTKWAPFVFSVWIEDEKLPPNLATLKHSLLPPDTWTQIDRLRQFIQDYPFPHSSSTSHSNQYQDHDRRNDYKSALSSLESSIRQIELAGPNIEFGMPILWAYRLSKRFRDDLEAYQPVALILLGHWCVLLHLVDHYWFVNGAARQLFEDIEKKIVHTGFQNWLTWPRQWVLER
ncbi:hypothetical protein N7510_001207 [Penicillium lagena]|uniref:uncharacterized protein n=1 Tax=Penicillium lagena TaxID=94218 RepID=UPI00253FD8CC|nr:uncharacterized protein N7510_001207 [Penicillium lagena]KAJ5624898.1 hypothetical protein N7510_001207 [Penicillium lagena]